ncbi:MAG: hypothetical protein V3T05_08035 [Myxococcota bacterium]
MTALSALRAAQRHAVDTLSKALCGRRLHHAYLLAGPLEAGGLELAEAVAASLVCSARREEDACEECAACRKAAGGNHPDIHRLTSGDKANISIDAVRYLDDRLALAAVEAGTKVVIIEEADRMTRDAQNAILKTLEEPLGVTCFLLVTARVRTLLTTVRSRCLTVRIAPLPRLGAWKSLEEAGVAANLARPLAALVGSNFERAQALVDLGAGEIHAGLRRALAPNARLGDILATAADLGSDRERTELALAFLEVEVRDRLATANGAGDEQLYLDPASLTPALPGSRLRDAAERLQTLRRLKALNINRTMSLENVLLALAGAVSEGSP